MRAELEGILDGPYRMAEAFLPAHFRTAGPHFAPEFAFEAREQNVQLHLPYGMQVPETAIQVMLHPERRVHAGKRVQTLFDMRVVFGTEAFHAGLQEGLVLIADGGGVIKWMPLP